MWLQKQLRDDEQLSWLSMQGVDLSQQAHLELREQGLGLLFIDQIRPSRKLNNATYIRLDIVRANRN